MLLKNEWVNNKVKEKIKTYLEANGNEDTTIQHLWHTGKAVLRKKYISLLAYQKKQENFQINNLILHIKELEKEQQQ